MELLQVFKTLVDILHFILYSLYAFSEAFVRLLLPKTPKSLAGETILITGSGDGIGREICYQLADSGARLILWDIDKGKNDSLIKELRAKGVKDVYAFQIDVSDRLDVDTAADIVLQEIGDVSIIINNAGIAPIASFLSHTPSQIESIFRVNVLSHFWILGKFLPRMITKGSGHIVSVSSIAAFKGHRSLVPYGTTKSAVQGYMQGLQEELRHHPSKPRIKFTTVFPTMVKTRMTSGVNVKFRFPWFTPILEPSYVAKRLIDGIRREEEYVHCPPQVILMKIIPPFFPRKVIDALTDFLEERFEFQEQKQK